MDVLSLKQFGELLRDFGPAGMVVFLVYVCLKKASSAREDAYKSRNRHRILVDSTIYCVNWVAVFVFMALATWVFFTLSVRPIYVVKGVVTGATGYDVKFVDEQVIVQRSARDLDKMDWVITHSAKLKGRKFVLSTRPALPDGGGVESYWTLPIGQDYYESGLQIVLKSDPVVPGSLVPWLSIPEKQDEVELKPALQRTAR